MGVMGVRVTFLRHVSAKVAISRSGLLRMCWTSSLACSSGRLLSELMTKSALDEASEARVATEEASRLMPAVMVVVAVLALALVVVCPDLLRRLSLSAS